MCIWYSSLADSGHGVYIYVKVSERDILYWPNAALSWVQYLVRYCICSTWNLFCFLIPTKITLEILTAIFES
jgi:hypothetical protein